MKEFQDIPSALIERWEQEAIDQRLPYTEYREFLRMKKEKYWQSSKRESQTAIFTNNARNKLTEYGQKVALDYLLQIPLIERTCKFAKYDLEELQKQLLAGFSSEEQKEMFVTVRDQWFQHLKDRMKELSINKETLESYGLNWKQAKAFAYQTL